MWPDERALQWLARHPKRVGERARESEGTTEAGAVGCRDDGIGTDAGPPGETVPGTEREIGVDNPQ